MSIEYGSRTPAPAESLSKLVNVSLEIPEEVRPGESVLIKASVAGVNGRPLTLYGGEESIEFLILREGELIWSTGEPSGDDGVLREISWPFDRRPMERSLYWNQTDNDCIPYVINRMCFGEPAPVGEYQMQGIFQAALSPAGPLQTVVSSPQTLLISALHQRRLGHLPGSSGGGQPWGACANEGKSPQH